MEKVTYHSSQRHQHPASLVCILLIALQGCYSCYQLGELQNPLSSGAVVGPWERPPREGTKHSIQDGDSRPLTTSPRLPKHRGLPCSLRNTKKPTSSPSPASLGPKTQHRFPNLLSPGKYKQLGLLFRLRQCSTRKEPDESWGLPGTSRSSPGCRLPSSRAAPLPVPAHLCLYL